MISAVLHLKPERDRSLERRHPWVFSGAIARVEGTPEDGDCIRIVDASGRTRGVGHFQAGGSIRARILAFEEREIAQDFWQEMLANAFRMRAKIGVCDAAGETNAFRLVHGEGDGLPGLVVDIYNDTAVIQPHSSGMHRSVLALSDALRTLCGDRLAAVVLDGGIDEEPQLVWGESEGVAMIRENGLSFCVDLEHGQKTGFFLDQREHRALVRSLAHGCRVLNAFSYTGGFSLAALAGGAERVTSVDSSARAVSAIDGNIALNPHLDAQRHQGVVDDMLQFLKRDGEGYDLMILDPPAFAKHRSARHQAIQAYRRLNETALQKIRPEGLLLTFSCSQVVDPSMFRGAVMAAAVSTGRAVRVLALLHQPPDHPVSLFHPEGEYLKGMLLSVT